MQFSWSTFVVEIVNFLILVWVLQRVLYLPVKKSILDRKQKIQASMDAAVQLKSEAQLLQTQYENRLNEWDKEKTYPLDLVR